jgi:hypothetical protein
VVCRLATSSTPLRFDGVDGLAFNRRQHAPGKTGVEPGMLMKNKQDREESKRCFGTLKKPTA